MSVTEGTILRMVVTLLWQDGNIMQNVFNAVVTGVGAPWDADDIVQDAVSWAEELYANLTAKVSDQVDGSQVQVYEYDSIDDDWDEVGAAAFTWDPTQADEEFPRGIAALINLKSTDPDTSGKKYIGGITESDNDSGVISGPLITALAAFAIDWYTSFVGTDSGADWAPGIWSVKDTLFRLALPSVIIPAIYSYQRRRKRGVGV